MKRTLFIAILSLAAACGSKKTGDNAAAGSAAPTGGSATATAPTPAGSAAATPVATAPKPVPAKPEPAKGSAQDVPASVDYEAKAKADITDKNAAQQLTDLEKDLPQ